jgi:DNA invertase Pin-like site-specific DNA recombinase
MMLERQRDGIAKAKAQGKYKGRKPTAQAKKAEVVAMAAAGSLRTDIGRTLGISQRSVYRLLETV